MSSSKAKREARVVYVRRVYGNSANSDLDFDAFKGVDYMVNTLFEPARNAEKVFFAILKILFP